MVMLLLMSGIGCVATTAQYQQVTSGLIGCRPEEITIANEDPGSIGSWEATCRGRLFYCSNVRTSMSCTPALGAAAPSGPESR
jgi:hypothetical protein